MHNLRHFYYQNKQKIWKVVLIIAFILGIIYFLNYLQKNGSNSNNLASNNKDTIYSDQQNKTYISNQSAVSGQTVTEKEVQTINSTISKFLQYCKNKQYEQAYNMLSDDCKENEYDTLEKFQDKYIGAKFNKDALYEIEKWMNNTYKISIANDLLSTGNVNDTQRQVEYITIVEENDIQKLNINSYIGKSDINKEITKDDIKITAVSERIYMDYEIYDFKIENISNNTIKVDSLEKIGTMYLVDASGNKYNAYANEILDDEIEIRKKHDSNISIKYANTYSSRNNIKKIVFENVILDYIKYKTTSNLSTFDAVSEFVINL